MNCFSRFVLAVVRQDKPHSSEMDGRSLNSASIDWRHSPLAKAPISRSMSVLPGVRLFQSLSRAELWGADLRDAAQVAPCGQSLIHGSSHPHRDEYLGTLLVHSVDGDGEEGFVVAGVLG